MGCFLRCFSTRSTHHKPTKPQDVRGRGRAAEILPDPNHTGKPADSSTDANILVEKSKEGVSKEAGFDPNVKTCELSPKRGTVDDSVDIVKESKGSADGPLREMESIPALDECLSDKGEISIEEESSESLISISIDSRSHHCGDEIGGKEVSSPVFVEDHAKTNDESGASGQSDMVEDEYLVSLLKPVENLLLSRTLKGRATPPLRNQAENKENACVRGDGLLEDVPIPSPKLPDRILKPSSRCDSPQIQDISVDASLSSWLVKSESSSESHSSTVSIGASPLETVPTSK